LAPFRDLAAEAYPEAGKKAGCRDRADCRHLSAWLDRPFMAADADL
jgi:hypothetical protein